LSSKVSDVAEKVGPEEKILKEKVGGVESPVKLRAAVGTQECGQKRVRMVTGKGVKREGGKAAGGPASRLKMKGGMSTRNVLGNQKISKKKGGANRKHSAGYGGGIIMRGHSIN